MVEGAGFEPAKAVPSDLQSDPFGRSGTPPQGAYNLVEGAGFEPAKAVPSDLQSDPFGRSGTPPNCICVVGGGGGWIRTSEGSAVRFTV